MEHENSKIDTVLYNYEKNKQTNKTKQKKKH